MGGYKLVNRFTGTAYESSTLVNRFRETPYPIPSVFESYKEAFRVVNRCGQDYRVVVVPASFHTPMFVLGNKVYPCPAKDEPVIATYYGSYTKLVITQEHPCLSKPGKMCHHVWCAWEAHSSDDYQCQQS